MRLGRVPLGIAVILWLEPFYLRDGSTVNILVLLKLMFVGLIKLLKILDHII